MYNTSARTDQHNEPARNKAGTTKTKTELRYNTRTHEI